MYSNYKKAIKTITDLGGWVFRLGDPSLTPLPSNPFIGSLGVARISRFGLIFGLMSLWIMLYL